MGSVQRYDSRALFDALTRIKFSASPGVFDDVRMVQEQLDLALSERTTLQRERDEARAERGEWERLYRREREAHDITTAQCDRAQEGAEAAESALQAAEAKGDALAAALRMINTGECEIYTVHSCARYGRKPDGEYFADRMCNSCIASNALHAQGEGEG